MKNPFQRKPEVEKSKRSVSVGREYFEMFAEVLIYVFFINAFLLQFFVIPTPSMERTLLVGDHLLVDKVSYCDASGRGGNFLLPQVAMQRGMIVTFKAPPSDPGEDAVAWERFMQWVAERDPVASAPYPPAAKEYVKRLIALPGDTLRVAGRQIFLNGEAVEEPYARFSAEGGSAMGVFPPASDDGWAITFPRRFYGSVVATRQGPAFKVPPGHCFCMGDNRDNSLDCRYWGPVPIQYIVGRPWRILWSYESRTEEYLTPGILHKIKDIALTMVRFFSHTRWERTIKKIK